MLVKEYRIPLPLSVDEYRIAQLYMIAKKSKIETSGAGSGVEILVNEPYVDGPGGEGQYTHKIYHVGHHLPGWLKAILPKSLSALTVEEEAWNAYPYTKTRYTCPLVEKFFIEIETRYFNDNGSQENVFGLTKSELRNRIVDVIDIVKDQLYGSDYTEDEDPIIYVSNKTKRGPLSVDWINDYWTAINDNHEKGKNLMCAYKLTKVEFKYWGMQSKIEKFIHESALRRTMLRAHRQAWAWQDEWLGLTMEDIRCMEREIQEQLAKKMAQINHGQEGEINDASVQDDDEKSPSRQAINLDIIDKDKDDNNLKSLSIDATRNKAPSTLVQGGKKSSSKYLEDDKTHSDKTDSPHRKCSASRSSKPELNSPGDVSNHSFDVQFANWRMESIANDDGSSSNEEFYDAKEMLGSESLAKWSSLEYIAPEFSAPEATKEVQLPGHEDSIFSTSFIHKTQIEHSRKHISAMMMARGSIETSAPSSPTTSSGHQTPCMTNFLLIVIHGGNILESGAEPLTSKKSDLTTFKGSFESIIRLHFPSLSGKLAFRLISAPAICADALTVLSSLSPYSFQSSPSAVDGVCHSYDAVPIGSLPLFAVSSAEYQENITKVITAANQVYHDFMKSGEGLGFTGNVILIGDSIGSVIAYDALCRSQINTSHCGSENSVNDMPENSGNNSRPKSISPANLGPLNRNPLIAISDDGSGIEDVDEDGSLSAIKRANSPINRASSPFTSGQAHQNSIRKNRLTKAPGHRSLAENEDNLHLCLKILSVPASRRRSSGSSDQSMSTKFDFDISDFFMFGSPLSLILTFRKMLYLDDKNVSFFKPNCTQIYNLFHPMDPSVLRIEPLISARFSHIPPINVPKYSKFLLDDDQAICLGECIQNYAHVFFDDNNSNNGKNLRRTSNFNIDREQLMASPLVQSLIQKWWGSKRIDYALYCPEGLTNFPAHSLPHLFHASYWESNDVVSFILKQLVRSDTIINPGIGREMINFVPNQSKEKWIKKRTSIKLKNFPANHRANDVIVKEGSDQLITARFVYGPLDVISLTGEKVDIHYMKDLNSGEWSYLSTEITDKNGRISYTIAKDKALTFGLYPFKLIVRGDHTSIDFFLAVVPPKTECVVFSIDGSFTASVSVTGRDPKVRAGAVDVVRHWQDLGYLIIYITGRPDMQQHRVISWLSQHNFPFGLVSFADKLSTDPLKHKADYLRHLQQEVDIVISYAYGSSKDIWVYQNIGLKSDQIYIVGKVSKKHQSSANILSEGYAAHLTDLVSRGGSRPAIGNARMVLPRECFGLSGFSGISFRVRQSAKKTMSYPLCVEKNKNNNNNNNSNNNNNDNNNSNFAHSRRNQQSSPEHGGTFSSFFNYHRSASNKSK